MHSCWYSSHPQRAKISDLQHPKLLKFLVVGSGTHIAKLRSGKDNSDYKNIIVVALQLQEHYFQETG